MSSTTTNASRTIQSSCKEVLQMIRWAETKGIPQEEQEQRHLRTKIFIQGQLEIIRGTVTDGVVVPRWMVALESAFRTLGNDSHPDYQALSQGRIPIPSDHPWLRYTVPAPPVPPVPPMPPAPTVAPPPQNPTNAPQAVLQPPVAAISNHPPAKITHSASVRPPPSTRAPAPGIQPPSQPSRATPATISQVSAPAANQSGSRPAPKVRRKAAVEPEAGGASGTTREVISKTEKRKAKAKEPSEPTEKRQERPKRRQADPEPMEIDGADDDDEIEVIEPELIRGRTKGRRAPKQRSPTHSRVSKTKARPSASDPEVDTATPTSPHTNKADCLNCVKYNRTCDKQEGMACKPCQQNKQKCEHSAKNKRRGVGSSSGPAEAPAQSASHRRTSTKRRSSASESRDSDDNEESSTQDGSTRQRKKTKVTEESENPLDDPRQTIIVPGPRGMTFAGVVPPIVPPDYPRMLVPASRPPTARPTRNPSGGRTGPAAVRPNPHANCASKAEFDALVERIRTLEQAVDILGLAFESKWSQRDGPLEYHHPTPHDASSAPPTLPSWYIPDDTSPRPSTPENQEGPRLRSSPTPRATSAREGTSRHATPVEYRGSPTTEGRPAESPELSNSSKGGCVDVEEDTMEVFEASG